MNRSDHVDHPEPSQDAARFGVWPPVALGVPLAVGTGATMLGGRPTTWPGHLDGVALLLAAVFVWWNGWSLMLLRRHHTGLLPGQPTTRLLCRGPYSLSRNPLYLGLVLLYVAIDVSMSSVWALALLPLGLVALVKGAIEPEETYLHKKFGAEYEAYRSRVRRWL